MAKPPRWLPALPLIAIAVSLPLPLYPYVWHKLLHIIGAIVFVGNVTVTAAWMNWAVKRKEAAVAAFASTSVNMADMYFTSPGAILLLLNGLAMAAAAWGGWLGFFQNRWISAGLTLLIVTTVVWAVGLRRYQGQMERISSKATEARGELPQEFYRAFQKWTIWGIVATVLPFVALYFMVAKPF